MRIKLLTLIIAGVALSATGCSNLRGWMGGDKVAPDEFRVVTRAPLSLPPDYGLVAPQPGAPRPQETDVRESARQIVVDRQGGTAAEKQQQQAAAALQGRDPAEAALLKRAGVVESDPNIRATINRESSKLAEADNTFVNKLMFWRGKEEPGVVVDADKEAKRIRENTALGRAATTGETPTISRKGEGGGLFGSL
jgi:hypothetical protein